MILYPSFVFISLIIHPPEDVFYGLTAHTSRLLLLADFRLLSRYIDRYAINYYWSFLWFSQPTYITLSWIKLIFEDIIDFVVQLLFFFLFSRIVRNSDFELFLTVSLILTSKSILSSVHIIYFKQTSRLSEDDLTWVMEAILQNCKDDLQSQNEGDVELQDNFSKICKSLLFWNS